MKSHYDTNHRPSRLARVSALLLAAGALLVGCNSGSSSSAVPPPTPTFTLSYDGNGNSSGTVPTSETLANGEIVLSAAEGDGPVNALDAAMRKALEPLFPKLQSMKLVDYKVRIIDGHAGTAAKTRVHIESTDGHRRWNTVGVSYNIIDASWKALLDSIEYSLL